MSDRPTADVLASLMITLNPANREQGAYFREQAGIARDAAACVMPLRQMHLEAMVLARQINHDVRQVDRIRPGGCGCAAVNAP